MPRAVLRTQWVSTALWERHKIRTLRHSLAEVASGAELGAEGELTISGMRVAVVYFRAGYSPDDYPTGAEWRARYMTEPRPGWKFVITYIVPSAGMDMAMQVPGGSAQSEARLVMQQACAH